MKEVLKLGYQNISRETKTKHMTRKLKTTCTNDFVEWMENSHRDAPTSFTDHGPY